jgi:hypothetical protein
MYSRRSSEDKGEDGYDGVAESVIPDGKSDEQQQGMCKDHIRSGTINDAYEHEGGMCEQTYQLQEPGIADGPGQSRDKYDLSVDAI